MNTLFARIYPLFFCQKCYTLYCVNAKKSFVAILVGFLAVFILPTLTDFVLGKNRSTPFSEPLFDISLLLLMLSDKTAYTVAWMQPLMSTCGPSWYSQGIVTLTLPSCVCRGSIVSIKNAKIVLKTNYQLYL